MMIATDNTGKTGADDDDDDDNDDHDDTRKKTRLSAVNEGLESIESTSTAQTVPSSKTPGGHGFPKMGDDESSALQCAARDLCKQQNNNYTLLRVDDTCICINCNFTAHLQCADNVFVQRPKKDGAIDYHSNLNGEGKKRVTNFKGNKDDIMICMSCMSLIESTVKSKQKQQDAPKKVKKATFEAFVKKVVTELRNLALFHAMTFVYTKNEQSNNTVKMNKLLGLYYGSAETKGIAEQVFDGDGPFARLYVMMEGPNGEERVLKCMYCGTDCNTSIVVNKHFRLIDMTHYSDGTKTLTAPTLWRHAAATVKICKKALSLVVQLSPQMVQVDATRRIVGYASGMSVMSFLKALNHGMYVLRDDEEFVRTANRADSGNIEENDMNDEPVLLRSDRAVWDPNDGGEAADGWIFQGYTAFALLGPACDNPIHYSTLLKSCADENQTKAERSEQSRATMRKSTGKEASVERQERNRNAVTMQTNCDIATIALANQEAREHALDRELLSLNSQIDGKKVEIQATQSSNRIRYCVMQWIIIIMISQLALPITHWHTILPFSG